MNQLNLFTPANVVGFFETIEELADFNFIPVRSILFKIFPFLADWETEYSYLLEHKVFTRLGALLVTACVLFGTLVAYKVLKIWRKIDFRLNGAFFKFKRTLFWNAPVSYLFESYLPLMLTTLYLLNDKEMINSDDPYSVVARVFSKIVLIVYLLAPAALTLYLGKKLDRGEFKTPEVQQSFSIAIEGWNYRHS